MRSLNILLSLFVVFICQLGLVSAQPPSVDKDPRISKYKKDIIKYLTDQYSGMNMKIGDSTSSSSDSVQIVIKKRLGLFSDSLNEDILLVSLGAYISDVPGPFWGVLTNEGRYFFYDADDLNEPDLVAFMKKYDHESVETVIFYCNQFRTLALGGIAMGLAVFNQKLDLVKQFIDKKDGVKQEEVKSAVSFLQKLTGIKPQFTAADLLQPTLTKQDYTNWLEWAGNNSSRLRWDPATHEVFLQ